METATGRIKSFSNLSATIPAGQTINVDSIPLADFLKADYKIKIFNQANNVFKGFELGSMRQGSTVDFNIFGILGDTISKTIQFSVVGSDVIFAVTNNELFDLKFSAVKFI